MKIKRVWPYVLPFPIDAKQRRLIWSILQSKVGMSLLMQMKMDTRTYQQELIRQMPYSNKSIIEYLKRMVKAQILDQGLEPQSTPKKRRVWIKWYMPTQLGRWFSLFLKQPERIPLKTARKTIEDLFQLYSSGVVEVCQKYDLSLDTFHHTLDQHYFKEVIRKAPKRKAEVVVCGSAALDTYGSTEKLPAPEETVYVEKKGRYAGGMGANVAVALSKLGVPVAFIGKIGSDAAGRFLLERLHQNGVDVSHLVLAELDSLQTFILNDGLGKRWLFTLGSPNTAVSLTSPDEVNWKPVAQSRMVYIGEVFLEVAPVIAKFAKKHQKIVVYRPGTPYMRFGVEKLCDVLENVDIFLMNQLGWHALKEASKAKIETPTDLLKNGPTTIIMTKGSEGCEVYTQEGSFAMPVPAIIQRQFKVVDPTGAGDSFSAGVMKGVLLGWELRKTVQYGQVVATLTCSRLGATPAFLTSQMVESVFQNVK